MKTNIAVSWGRPSHRLIAALNEAFRENQGVKINHRQWGLIRVVFRPSFPTIIIDASQHPTIENHLRPKTNVVFIPAKLNLRQQI